MRCPMTGMAAYRTATGRAAPSAISRPMRWAVPTVPRCCDGWSRMWMSGGRLRGATITGWLREKVHQYGGLMEPADVVKNACGDFSPEDYIQYLTRKYTELYGL